MSNWIVSGVSPGAQETTSVKVAARLADRLGARLALLTVVPDPLQPGDRQAAKSGGGLALTRLGRKLGLPDDTLLRVEIGDPADSLVRVAAELDAELVVVGASRRAPGFGATLRRDLPARVIAAAKRPVAVVPVRAAEALVVPIESVVGGIRGSDERVREYVAGLASSLGVAPLVIQASDDGDPAYALERFADTERAGAIVIASRRRSRIARALRGSVTEALSRHAARPVVVLPSS
jgi:nucleotide-binding universal stress UspA family protein